MINKQSSRKIYPEESKKEISSSVFESVRNKIIEKSKSFKLIEYVKKHKVEKSFIKSTANLRKFYTNSPPHGIQQLKEKKKKIGSELLEIENIINDIRMIIEKEEDFDQIDQLATSISKFLVQIKQFIETFILQSKLSSTEDKKNIIVDTLQIGKPLQNDALPHATIPQLHNIRLEKNSVVPKIQFNNSKQFLKSKIGDNNNGIQTIEAIRPMTTMRAKSPPLHVLDRPINHGKVFYERERHPQNQLKQSKQQQYLLSLATFKQFSFNEIK